MTRKSSAPLAELASFIESLGEPQILTDLDYRILAANKAYRDAYAPHESVVGRHCDEVSHHYALPCEEAGESCPRRAALVSRRTEQALHMPSKVVSPGAGDRATVAGTSGDASVRVLRSAERNAPALELARHDGRRRARAETLGIREPTLYRKLPAYGLSARRREAVDS